MAAAQRTQAEEDCLKFGIPIQMDPRDALLHGCHVTAGEVAFYRAKVAALTPEQFVYGVDRVTRTRRGRVVEDRQTIVSRPNTWVKLLEAAERHHADVVAEAVKLNIATRLIEAVEQRGELLHDVMQAALQGAGLSWEQRAAVLSQLPVAFKTVAGEVTE